MTAPETRKAPMRPEQMREDAKTGWIIAGDIRAKAKREEKKGYCGLALVDHEKADAVGRLASAAEELAQAREDHKVYVLRAEINGVVSYYSAYPGNPFYVADPKEARHFTCLDCARVLEYAERTRIRRSPFDPLVTEVVELTALLAEGQPAKGEGGAS